MGMMMITWMPGGDLGVTGIWLTRAGGAAGTATSMRPAKTRASFCGSCTPAIADIDRDGHQELVVAVTYYFDRDKYDTPVSCAAVC